MRHDVRDQNMGPARRRATSEASGPKERAKVEEQLVRSHLSLVNYLVWDLAGRLPRNTWRADLVSAGMAGLAQAARSYDADRGVSFRRFASSLSGRLAGRIALA